jgi:hypothetical protein
MCWTFSFGNSALHCASTRLASSGGCLRDINLWQCDQNQRLEVRAPGIIRKLHHCANHM